MTNYQKNTVAKKTTFLALISNYLEFYCDHNSHTARAKRLDLQKFLDFLCHYQGYSKTEKIPVSDWNQSNVQSFVESLLNHGESPATVSRRLATLKHLGRVLADSNPNIINPTRQVKTPKIRTEKPAALSPQEIKKIRTHAQQRINHRDNFNRYRNSIIFELLLDTGLRADEIRLLKIAQLDPDLEWIKAVRTKGRRYRNVYISTNLRQLLKQYLTVRMENLKKHWPSISLKVDKQMPLFISTYGAKAGDCPSYFMGAKTLWRAINELSAKTKLHPHLLRHAYALDLLDSSNDLRLVSQALGHSDIRVTMRYTERSDQQVANAVEKSRKHAKVKKTQP